MWYSGNLMELRLRNGWWLLTDNEVNIRHNCQNNPAEEKN